VSTKITVIESLIDKCDKVRIPREYGYNWNTCHIFGVYLHRFFSEEE
jgi:hypothetical protein